MMKIKAILNDIRNYNLRKGSINKNCGITLISLVVTIIILLILGGIAIATLTGENGLFARAKQAKENYSISSAKEKLQLAISDLMVEQTSKGENLTKEDLPKINNNEIDVKSIETFPVEVICENYIFNVDENFTVTYVREASGTVVTFTTEPESYTNKDEIKILVKISNPKGIKSIQKPGETDRILAQGQKEVGIDYKVTKNGHYIFTIVDEEGKETVKDVYIDLIDKLEPLDFEITAKLENDKIVISGTAQDAEKTEESTKSGIEYYEYYLIDKDKKETKYNTNEILKDTVPFGEYKVYAIAYDRAGNSKQSNIVELTISTKTKIVATGYSYSMTIDVDGNLLTCGRNDYGQLGDGTTTNKTIPVKIKPDTKFKQISAGNSHSLAIDEEGNLWAWGNNGSGRLGDGTTENKKSPIKIKPETKFIQIACGVDFTVTIDSEGNLWSWGHNGNGQLGDGTMTNKLSPVQITSGTKFTQISVGSTHSLAIDEEGNLWSWGVNSYGQLGDGTQSPKLIPVQITSSTKFTQISAGYNDNSLAIDEEGNLWACGRNYEGQLGDGTKINKLSLVQITKGIKFKQLSIAPINSFAIDSEGNLWAWGNNYSGQVGDGTKIDRLKPVRIMKGIKFIQVSAKFNHRLAIDEEGNLWAWGEGRVGQLMDGTVESKTIPTKVIY